MAAREVKIDIRGESVTLTSNRTAFWKGMLMVADLHWGKAQSFQASGIASPCTLDEDLARLRNAIAESRPDAIVVLGDLIHDARSITTELDDRISAWRSEVECEIVLTSGNHDRHVDRLPPRWHIRAVPELTEGPFLFRHTPRAHAKKFVWAGHLHPACVVRGTRDRLRLPCFAIDASVGILPSFGRLTGGAVVRGDYRRFVVTEDAIAEL